MKPIGYWLNRTDQAFTTAMNTLLADAGLTRLSWQVLNVVQDTPDATDHDVLTVLAANAEPAELTAAVEAVLADGWADRPAPGRLALTDHGRTRLARAGEQVDAFRESVLTGITHEEYRTAVTVLERMTRNVESAPAPTAPAPTAPAPTAPAPTAPARP
ncbi:MarR family winged helix-turn-helix transcriptional regulator [Kitasatospora sp. NPDC127111]|uniref:MarR family winged helix-turn-helix transcriptional regulator n=1 Tax=Kitasatospora sp. NPDC127111 TaxID=3345363 RepID=UPI00363FB5AD